ncbi:MAG: SET domain-containing protein [Pseudohongiellaceae bacterium]
MIHPDTTLRFISDVIGHGVFATRPIPRGTITWALDPLDRVLEPAQIAALPAGMNFDVEHHAFVGRDGRLIMPWDLGRFMNHSCAPNCLATESGYEIAIRDIAPGEELTNDYANLGMQAQERILCGCGAASCRGVVTRVDAAKVNAMHKAQLSSALALAGSVEQPLLFLLDAAQQLALQAAGTFARAETVCQLQTRKGGRRQRA